MTADNKEFLLILILAVAVGVLIDLRQWGIAASLLIYAYWRKDRETE